MHRKPKWLKVNLYRGSNIKKVNSLLENLNLKSVCHEAKCPNRTECYNNKVATFLILGTKCTRNCSFCNIPIGEPGKPNKDEPLNIAKAVRTLKLNYVVLTSVTRDDLKDGGAEHFCRVINSIKEFNKDVKVEVLIPDFRGDKKSLLKVIKANPMVINHNMETVKSLYYQVRKGSDYTRSLKLLKSIKEESDIYSKSGIMLGLGESKDEILTLLQDLRSVNCDYLTIGQYLPPSASHYPIKRYIAPSEFLYWERIAYKLGFNGVVSGPKVRSSYRASKIIT